MANPEIQNVRPVLEAIKAEDVERAIQHVDKHFVQHDSCKADGAEGLKQYSDGFAPEQLNLTVVRVFQDGPYVVTQLKAHGSSEDMQYCGRTKVTKSPCAHQRDVAKSSLSNPNAEGPSGRSV